MSNSTCILVMLFILFICVYADSRLNTNTAINLRKPPTRQITSDELLITTVIIMTTCPNWCSWTSANMPFQNSNRKRPNSYASFAKSSRHANYFPWSSSVIGDCHDERSSSRDVCPRLSELMEKKNSSTLIMQSSSSILPLNPTAVIQ